MGPFGGTRVAPGSFASDLAFGVELDPERVKQETPGRFPLSERDRADYLSAEDEPHA